MMRLSRWSTVALVFMFPLLSAAQTRAPVAEHFPGLIAGETPEYPPLARLARLTGDVTARIETDGHVVTNVQTEGHPMLSAPVAAFVKTWQFGGEAPSSFTTTFHFEFVMVTGCPAILDHDKVVLDLPNDVTVTAWIPKTNCDPNFGLDLSEPLRVFLTECETDGTKIPCEAVRLTITQGVESVVPKRFKQQNGLRGFYVPSKFRNGEPFGVVVQMPKGKFSMLDINSAFLRGRWRVIIDHAPFQDDWRYLTKKNQRCLGVIHFQWSEPERLVSTSCG